MAKTKQEKQEIMRELTDAFGKSTSVVFANFSGLPVKEAETLRKQARVEQIGIVVAKKTLLEKATTDAGLTDVSPRSFGGEVLTLFGYGDEVAPARLLHKFGKTHSMVKMIGGILERHFVSAAKIKELALLPSKQELLAKLVGSMNAPVSGFVNVLAGNLRGLVRVLDGIRVHKS
ncbi:MAG: 50S ribosomal protein L10 [Patescibacteria group bacterium]